MQILQFNMKTSFSECINEASYHIILRFYSQVELILEKMREKLNFSDEICTNYIG